DDGAIRASRLQFNPRRFSVLRSDLFAGADPVPEACTSSRPARGRWRRDAGEPGRTRVQVVQSSRAAGGRDARGFVQRAGPDAKLAARRGLAEHLLELVHEALGERMVDGLAVELGEFLEQFALARGQAARRFDDNLDQLIAAAVAMKVDDAH